MHTSMNIQFFLKWAFHLLTEQNWKRDTYCGKQTESNGTVKHSNEKQQNKSSRRFAPFLFRNRKSRSSSPKVSSATPKLEKIYERSTKIPTSVISPLPRNKFDFGRPCDSKTSTEIKTNNSHDKQTKKQPIRNTFLPVFSSSPVKVVHSQPKLTDQKRNCIQNHKIIDFLPSVHGKTQSGSIHLRTSTISSSKSSSSSSSSKSASSTDSITTVIPAKKPNLLKKNSSWLFTRFKGRPTVV